MSNQVFDRIPELAHLNEAKFIDECTQILHSAQPRRDLKGFAQSVGLADFAGRDLVAANRQETADLLGMQHEPRLRVEIKLQTRPGQRIVKNIRIAFCPVGRREAHVFELDVPVQFLGYGPYTLSFYRPGQSGSRGFDAFFSELSRNKVNFHRTLLFGDEGHEDIPNPVRLLVKKGADPKNAEVNPVWLSNLNDMVRTAKKYNIVVQVCLFSHHAVAGADWLSPPAPLTLRDMGRTPLERYRNFYKVGSPWQPLQERLIRAVTQVLVGHWNVVYEVGNEMRVPRAQAGDPAYHNQDLRNWIAWAADLLKRCSYGKLVTTSTGLLSQNEAIINRIPQIVYGSFHGGQWDTGGDNQNLPAEMQAALDRCESYGDGHHLVIDDDGHPIGRNNAGMVRYWAALALDLGGKRQCSFNHKGPYRPWVAGDPFGEGRDELQALAQAWTGIFHVNAYGFSIPRPNPDLFVKP